jgi:hypothetical protein
LDDVHCLIFGFKELDESAAIHDPSEFSANEVSLEFEHSPLSGGGFAHKRVS